MVPPTPEQSPLHVNPTGEVLLEMIDTHIFTVLEHEGDPDTSYFSMHTESGTLLHGVNPPATLSTSTLTGSSTQTALHEILYTLPSHLAQYLPNSNKDYGFFTLASKVYFDQVKNVKEITLAVALQDVCHRVYVNPREENFALQLIEFFDVEDYAVSGYKLPLSVTSLHTHLWNVAVDYRPLYLPWQLLLTVQSLGVSSNLALESSVTSLRVLLEDLALHLAPSTEPDSHNTPDYVKLIDLDLFELLIKMLISPSDTAPQLEIEVKNNMLHVATCADSCAALRDILVYCSSEGDLYDPCEWTASSSEEVPRTTRVREHSSSDDIPSLVKSAVTEIKKSSSSSSSSTPSSTTSSSAVPSSTAPSLDLNTAVRSDHVTPAYSKQTFTFPDDSPTVGREYDIANAVDDESEDLPISINIPPRWEIWGGEGRWEIGRSSRGRCGQWTGCQHEGSFPFAIYFCSQFLLMRKWIIFLAIFTTDFLAIFAFLAIMTSMAKIFMSFLPSISSPFMFIKLAMIPKCLNICLDSLLNFNILHFISCSLGLVDCDCIIV